MVGTPGEVEERLLDAADLGFAAGEAAEVPAMDAASVGRRTLEQEGAALERRLITQALDEVGQCGKASGSVAGRPAVEDGQDGPAMTDANHGTGDNRGPQRWSIIILSALAA